MTPKRKGENMKKEQVQTSFYLTKNLRDLSRFLHKREEITKIVFYRRALKYYFEIDGEVDSKVLITERNHPDYIRRDAPETVKIDLDLKAKIEELALEKGYKEGQIIFSAVVDYCVALLKLDSTGVTI